MRMRMFVALAFNNVDDASVFKSSYDMSLTSGIKLMFSVDDKICIDDLDEIFEEKNVCYIIMNINQDFEFVFEDDRIEAAA